MFYDRFKELCLMHGKSPTAVGIELGFSKGTISAWKHDENINLNVSSLIKIADYFGVSMDFLMEREPMTTDPSMFNGIPYVEYANLSKKDREFIDDLIRRMNETKGG